MSVATESMAPAPAPITPLTVRPQGPPRVAGCWGVVVVVVVMCGHVGDDEWGRGKEMGRVGTVHL
jgi:hypothetical protein